MSKTQSEKRKSILKTNLKPNQDEFMQFHLTDYQDDTQNKSSIKQDGF